MVSPKYRDYFITINESAECYNDALEIVKDLNTSLYALIIHDKDVNIETNENGEAIETPKKTHKHVIIELKNPITFNSMQNHFPGSHIESVKYKKAAYQYLLHNRPNAREKYQYPFEDIISNNLASVKAAIDAEEGLRQFRENEFLTYIVEGIVTPYQFVKAFGLGVYKQYWKSYSSMLIEAQTDEEMRRDMQAIRDAMEDDLPF